MLAALHEELTHYCKLLGEWREAQKLQVSPDELKSTVRMLHDLFTLAASQG